jgi:hypothetical protein
MAGWDTSMPLDFTDGQLVDEGDLDPIVNNVNWLRYAAVFQGGVRRITDVTGITTTETNVMQTPSVTLENGYLYKIEGMLKFKSSVATDTLGINVREGAGLGGATPQSFAVTNVGTSAATAVAFNVYIKCTSPITRPYTVGVYRFSGTGTFTVYSTSWTAIVRSGDNALMTDV